MNKYEVLYIISSKVSEENREAMINKFKDVITKENGTIDKLDKWGIKKYQYPINFENEGYYVLVGFTCAPSVIEKLKSLMLVTEGCVRFMFEKK